MAQVPLVVKKNDHQGVLGIYVLRVLDEELLVPVL
jgi:hypothetical protein